MHRRILIITEGERFHATLNHSATAAALWEILPVESQADVAPGQVVLVLERVLPPGAEQREELAIGELAYRSQDAALVIYLDRTPASRSGEPRAESPVSPVGMLERAPERLAGLAPGDRLRLEAFES